MVFTVTAYSIAAFLAESLEIVCKKTKVGVKK